MDELYDAITSGVEPGGLRSKSEIKLLICYILSRLDFPFTKEQLIQIICKDGLANYFEASQDLSEVVENGNISLNITEDGEIPQLTPLGKNNIASLEADLPLSVKEQALKNALDLSARIKCERENKIEIVNSGNGYTVNISIVDGKDVLMSLGIYAADFSQAQSIKDNFTKDPAKVYSTIVSLLMA